MIKPQELRYGILVTVPQYEGSVAKVLGFNAEIDEVILDMYSWGENSYVASKEIEGIPLNDKILEKIGPIDPTYLSFVNSLIKNNKIKYLHQLQNIYFDLKGEDLSMI